jgi:hypothetical protein
LTRGLRGGFVFRMGKIDFFGFGGESDIRGISRPGDGIKPFHLVAPLDNITINNQPRWGGRNRPGDRMAASF